MKNQVIIALSIHSFIQLGSFYLLAQIFDVMKSLVKFPPFVYWELGCHNCEC